MEFLHIVFINLYCYVSSCSNENKIIHVFHNNIFFALKHLKQKDLDFVGITNEVIKHYITIQNQVLSSGL